MRPRSAVAALVVLVLVAAVGGIRAAGAAGSDPVPVAPGTFWRPADEALGASSGSASVSDAGAPVDAEADAGRGAGTAPVDAADGATGDDAAGGDASDAVVVVHVAGRVAHPGVVELPVGARVHQAVDAAGGAREGADLDLVNLARPVVDGERVYVPAAGEPVPRGGAPETGAASPVNLNSAGLADLDDLPGIGPVLAQRILDWRLAHGRFTAVAELGEVSGIGPTLLARLGDLVTV